MNEPLKIITLQDIEIVQRKDFYKKFNSLLKELFEKSNLNLFNHNIIYNYNKPGHKVSSFISNEEWSEAYWTNFGAKDPLEKVCHSATQQQGVGLSSWQLVPENECMHARTTICKVNDGVLMAFKQKSGLIENMNFGWKKFDTDTLTPKRIELLNRLIAPLRQYHLSAHGL
jgi:hypothetical protein